MRWLFHGFVSCFCVYFVLGREDAVGNKSAQVGDQDEIEIESSGTCGEDDEETTDLEEPFRVKAKIRNTFLHLEVPPSEASGPLEKTFSLHSAPPRLGDQPVQIAGRPWTTTTANVPDPSAVMKSAPMPSTATSSSADPQTLALLPVPTSELQTKNNNALQTQKFVEAAQLLSSQIPQVPGNFGRATKWEFGPFNILLGSDLLVFRSDDGNQPSLTSLKLVPGQELDYANRLDAWLENVMCNVDHTVWGYGAGSGDGSFSRVDMRKTAELRNDVDDGATKAADVLDAGNRLLHFLKQRCTREGGTYWLFRDMNADNAYVYDVSAPTINEKSAADHFDEDVPEDGQVSQSPLYLPIASLCFRLAKEATSLEDHRRLLIKGIEMLQPHRRENAAVFAMAEFHLASSYATPPPAPESVHDDVIPPPAAARLSVALRHFENAIKVLAPWHFFDAGEQPSSSSTSRPRPSQDEDQNSQSNLILQQLYIAYTETCIKLVQEAWVPIYGTWLKEVQQTALSKGFAGNNNALERVKNLSLSFLLVRLIWLARAEASLSLLPESRRNTECWKLEKLLWELKGDVLFGLSCYPKIAAKQLTSGQNSKSSSIVKCVSAELRRWATDKSISHTQELVVSAMFLSKMSVFRGLWDNRILQSDVVRDENRVNLIGDSAVALASLEHAVRRLEYGLGPTFEEKRRTAAKGGPGAPAASDVLSAEDIGLCRKLGSLYNDRATKLLKENAQGIRGGDGDGLTWLEAVSADLRRSYEWMVFVGDIFNASRVLLNMSEQYIQSVEKQQKKVSDYMRVGMYVSYLRAIRCCEQAIHLARQQQTQKTDSSDAPQIPDNFGKRDLAFAHLRLGVFATRYLLVQDFLLSDAAAEPSPAQSRTNSVLETEGAISTGVFSSDELPELWAEYDASSNIHATKYSKTPLSLLTTNHLNLAVEGFKTQNDPRERAVAEYHLADCLVSEVSSDRPLSVAQRDRKLKAARTHCDAAMRQFDPARYPHDFLSVSVQNARIMILSGATAKETTTKEKVETDYRRSVGNALLTLQAAENRFVREAKTVTDYQGFVTRVGTTKRHVVKVLRQNMGKVCQEAIKRHQQPGANTDKDQVAMWKTIFTSVLKNEELTKTSLKALGRLTG